MKKLVLAALIAMAVSAVAFAQSYTVQEITGRVERDAGGGKWELVKAEETIKAGTVIKTGIGASLKIKLDDQVLTIGPAKTGKIEEIAGSGAGITLQGKVSQTDTSAAGRSSGSAVTASARASSAAAEIDIAEE